MERIDRAEGYPYMTERKITLVESLKKCVLAQEETIRQLRNDKQRLVQAIDNFIEKVNTKSLAEALSISIEMDGRYAKSR